jgi:lysine/ornithine N-monooxygenase
MAKNESQHKTRRKTAKGKLYEIPNYAQSEEFTSSAACAIMVLKYINKNFKPKKEDEFSIWNEAVNGSVWHGSKYGLAYAMTKRGAKLHIVSSNQKDEGYERKLAVYEGINLDTLRSSFNEIKEKTKAAGIKEVHGIVTVNTVKNTINNGNIPILLVDANKINPYLDSSPHWIVVKGYDEDSFYINDPYSDSTIAIEPNALKEAIGYENEYHMVVVKASRR